MGPESGVQPYSLFSITRLSLNLSQRPIYSSPFWDTTLGASRKINSPIGEKAEVGTRLKKQRPFKHAGLQD
jgi:hypothetical protein